MPSGPNKALAFAPTALRPLHDFSIGSRLRFQVQQSFMLTRVCAALRVVYPSSDFANRGLRLRDNGLDQMQKNFTYTSFIPHTGV